jgi:Zn-dependent protease with chaperone function/Flp pilus assembly protein TadD
MKKAFLIMIAGLALFASLVLFASPAAAQQKGGRDLQAEQVIYNRLAAINPGAVAPFKIGTEAMDAGDLPAAKENFEQVLSLAPGFPDALRRLSYVEQRLGDLPKAELLARQALQFDPSPVNQSAVALVLVATNDKSRLGEAMTLAKAAVAAEPDVYYNYYVWMSVAVAAGDYDAMRQSSRALLKLDPVDPTGHYIAGMVAAHDGQYEQAEKDLRMAEEFGYPTDAVAEQLNSGITTQANLARALRWSGIGLGAWLGGLLLLFLAGLLLSRLTLKAVDREIASGSFALSPREALVRRVYRLVVTITSGYFYISIPILILIIAGLVGGIIYIMMAAGQLFIRLAMIVLIAGIYTLVAVVRSLFVSIKNENPGHPVTPQEMPALWDLAREVAQRLNTRPVDTIFLTPGVEIGVFERGNLLRKMRNQGQRYLILGMGALSGLTQAQLRAILAHEYGHFNNRDTAGGGFASLVQRSLYTIARNLAYSGMATWYNPAWWFVNIYNRIFLRVTLGASRLQEILADRFAALAYGAPNLAGGLEQLIRQDLTFAFQLDAEVKQAVEQKRSLHNLYTLPPLADASALEKALAENMRRQPSAYHSHPAPQVRLALIERIKSENPPDDDPRPAWDLIEHAGQFQEEATALLGKRLLNNQILYK